MITSPTPRDADPLCRQDPELFFATTVEEVAAAKKVCRRCPLIEPCLNYSLVWSVQGVWGGTAENERQGIREWNGIVPKPIATTYEARARHQDTSEERRAEVARLTALGYTAGQIADRLRITKRSVVRNRAEMRDAS